MTGTTLRTPSRSVNSISRSAPGFLGTSFTAAFSPAVFSASNTAPKPPSPMRAPTAHSSFSASLMVRVVSIVNCCPVRAVSPRFYALSPH